MPAGCSALRFPPASSACCTETALTHCLHGSCTDPALAAPRQPAGAQAAHCVERAAACAPTPLLPPLHAAASCTRLHAWLAGSRSPHLGREHAFMALVQYQVGRLVVASQHALRSAVARGALRPGLQHRTPCDSAPRPPPPSCWSSPPRPWQRAHHYDSAIVCYYRHRCCRRANRGRSERGAGGGLQRCAQREGERPPTVHHVRQPRAPLLLPACLVRHGCCQQALLQRWWAMA
jgi:hypothetical protein